MPSRSVALMAALALSACGSSSERGARHAGPDALDADWLDGGQTITVDHLARLIRLGQRDPEARHLLDEAVARLGGGKLDELVKRFSPCPPGTATDAGLTVVETSDALVPRTIEELAFGKRPPTTEQALAQIQRTPAREVRLRVEPDYLVVERTLMPQICIVPRLSIAQAYEAVIHEFVHALRNDPREGRDLAGVAADEVAYRMGRVLAPGGEAEAYTASMRARIVLGYRGVLLSPLTPLFDPRSGAPRAGAAALAERILAPRPNGLGYADGLLRNALTEGRRGLVDDLSTKRSMLETVLGERRQNIERLTKNIDVHDHNIAVHRHNAGVATSRGDKALAEKSRAGLAAAERGLAETRAMLDAARASEARLSTELAAVMTQLDGIRPLLPAEGEATQLK